MATTNTATATATMPSAPPSQWDRESRASTDYAEADDKHTDEGDYHAGNGTTRGHTMGALSGHGGYEASTTTLANSFNHQTAMLSYNASAAAGHRTLAVDGADDNQAIAFSATSAALGPGQSKKGLYMFTPPRSPDSGDSDFPIEVQGLVEDVELRDVLTEQHYYTVRSDRDCKNFTVIPQTGSAAPNVILKPSKSLATYKCDCEAPNGMTWSWKGNIFKNMELYEKNKRGEKKLMAIYIRTSMGSHQFRVYPELLEAEQPIYSSHVIAFALATLYPFLAMYRRALEKDFTSDRRVLEKAAGARPSGWDARIMGSDPAAKKSSGANGRAGPSHSGAAPGNASPRDDRSIKTVNRRKWLPSFRKSSPE